MPRGIYDRSSLKKAKPEKTETTGAKRGPGRPRGRKPGKIAKAVVQETAGLLKNSEKGQGQAVAFGGGNLFLFGEIRQNLATLTVLADKYPDMATIKSEVSAHVETLSNLRKKVFGEKRDVSAAATSNGASATQYPSTVPMPPSPVPSIASH